MATQNAGIRLPSSEISPLGVLLRRLGIAAVGGGLDDEGIGELRPGERLVCLSSNA